MADIPIFKGDMPHIERKIQNGTRNATFRIGQWTERTAMLNQIISEVALSVTSSLDITQGLKDTKNKLAAHMPIDEMILLWVDDINDRLQFILRIRQDGVIDQNELSTFFLKENEKTVAREGLLGQTQNLQVYTRETLQHEIKVQNFEKYAQEIGVPSEADLLMLFDRDLHTGLVAVSYKNAGYTSEHVHLFEQLKGPFQTAMINALRYSELTRMRDALADDNWLFREATIRLTGETDMAKAFVTTLEFLSDAVRLQQVLLVTMNDDTRYEKLLLRVDASGTIEKSVDLSSLGTRSSKATIDARKEMLDHFPNVFVKDINDERMQQNLQLFEFNEKFHQWEINSDATTIILGVKDIRSGLLFVFHPSQQKQRCMHVIQTLKEPFIISLQNAIRVYALEEHKNRLVEENQELLNEMQREVGDRVIGMHDGLRHVMTLATQVAGKPSPVLLMGETGTGKEVIATAIHRTSERSREPFISLNCGAIAESLVDSELFGHEKGAFTGANERKRGRFERADGGTLFLDEIGELPASAQVKLLRVLQEKEFERVGGSQSIRADVRLIAATNRDLPDMIRKGQFREDLWFRLNVFPIQIPPLRERPQDIPALTYFFIETKIRQLNLPFRPSLPASEIQKLMQYDWPGNVRELQNTIERALILSRGEPLYFPMLNYGAMATAPQGDSFSREHADTSGAFLTFEQSNRMYLIDLLKRTGGKIAGPGHAAELSGLNPSTLRSKLKKLGITSADLYG